MKSQHIIVTKFNLRTQAFGKDKNNNITLSDEWYAERFHLFETICYPSITNQTNNKFSWYIFFDEDTPAEHRQRIDRYYSKTPRIIPVICNGMDSFHEKLREVIESEISQIKDIGYITTTRLDNDDGLREDFVALVSKYCKDLTQRTLIDFTSGYQLRISENNLVLRNAQSSFTPFISLFEPKEGYITVHHSTHRGWKNENINVITDRENQVWLQTIHDRNINNTMRYKGYLTSLDNLDRFHVTLKNISSSRNPFFIFYDTGRVTAKKIRMAIRSIYKKLIRKQLNN